MSREGDEARKEELLRTARGWASVQCNPDHSSHRTCTLTLKGATGYYFFLRNRSLHGTVASVEGMRDSGAGSFGGVPALQPHGTGSLVFYKDCPDQGDDSALWSWLPEPCKAAITTVTICDGKSRLFSIAVATKRWRRRQCTRSDLAGPSHTSVAGPAHHPCLVRQWGNKGWEASFCLILSAEPLQPSSDQP